MYPHNMQDVSSDCGIAVLKSLLQYYKRYVEEEFLHSISRKNFSQGLSLADISDILEEHNITGSCYEVAEPDEITFEFPTIVLTHEVAGHHYSLVYTASKEKLCVSNPSESDLMYIEKEDFFKKFAGYVYIVERIDRKKKVTSKKKTKIDFSTKEKRNILLFTTMQFVLPLFIVVSLQYLLVFRSLVADYQELLLIVLFYGAVISIQIINKELSKQQSVAFEYRGKQKEINAFMQKVDAVENRRSHNMYNDIITFWTNFNGTNKSLIEYEIKIEIFYFLLFLLILLYYSFIIFILTFIIILMLLSILIPKLHKLKNCNKSFLNKMATVSTFVEEYTKNKVDRFIFTNQQTVDNHIQKLLSNLRAEKVKTQKIESNITHTYDVIMYVGLLVIFCVRVISSVHKFSFMFDDYFLCFFIVYLLFSSLKATILKATELTKYTTIEHEAKRNEYGISQVLDQNEDIPGKKRVATIRLKDVSFSYNHHFDIFSSVNATMNAGELFLIDGDNVVRARRRFYISYSA